MELTGTTPRLKFEKALQTPRRQGGNVRTEADAQGTLKPQGAFVRHLSIRIIRAKRSND
jgi:hypothetical protein